MSRLPETRTRMVRMIADQLIADARDETRQFQGLTDGLATLHSWKEAVGLSETEIVMVALELATRCAGGDGIDWDRPTRGQP